MIVYVCPCLEKEKSMAITPVVIETLSNSGVTPVLDMSLQAVFGDNRAEYKDERTIVDECDMILTVGGDGMILKWSKVAAFADKPIIGINTGRLGFMTALDADETGLLTAIADGTYSLSRRMMLSAQIDRGGCKTDFTALNDIVFSKQTNSKLPEFTVHINGIKVTEVRADGMIFSTPTGSTAYALAAGGPVIEPTVECILLTPLCAHTMLSRPMIFSGNDTVSVSCSMYEGSRVNMSVDGGAGIEISESDIITIRKSGVKLRVVEINGRSFYGAVSEKLMAPLK